VSEQASFLSDARPSFAGIRVAEGRIAVVDVGSNSVRLVVFDGAARAPAYFFNEKVSCGLGAGIAKTGRLNPAGVASALETLRRFATLAERMHVDALEAVATAAVREAEDGPAFRAAVERQTGLRLRVIEGEEEARLSALGVLLGEPDADGLVADMGGASLELAQLRDRAVGARLTLPLGPQRLEGLEGAALTWRIDEALDRAADAVAVEGRTLFVVGGSWRSVAKLRMARRRHPLKVLQGYADAAGDVAEDCAWIAQQKPEVLRAMADVSAARAETAPLAALVLRRIIARLRPARVSVSAFGLREGVYFERLPPAVRDADPLIAVCRSLERMQARFPGFGDELARWLEPVLGDWPEGERRLARAACLLNDVNWRAHPDYRPISCFETVTRANLAGVDHGGRVFMGLALMQRYGGGERSADAEAAMVLLDPARKGMARALGRAMRLGAMLSASTPGALSEASLRVEDGAVSLTLGADQRALAGALVERRLSSLADALGLGARLAA
jgi:exopolyphosphatase/guanosine-5'-triphosphate,3'-diphosphate pyrophosphatase